MNLKIKCEGLEINFEEVQSLEELKARLQQALPSFVLESLTYHDEDDDIITLSDENDFNCLSKTSNLTVQVKGKFDQEQSLKEVKRYQKLTQRIENKVKQFKDRQKNNLVNRRNHYQEKLTKILQQQKQTQEIDKQILTIKQQYEFQEKFNSINNKIQIKCVIQEAMMIYHICQYAAKEEANLTYDEENLEQLMNKIEQLEQNVCEQFFKSYQSLRLNKLIEMKEQQIIGKENLLELSGQLNWLEKLKKKWLIQLKLQEDYYTSKLRDANCLLENL